MSTTAQIRSAWQTQVFDDATIQAISTNTLNFDFTELSSKERSNLRFGTEYNFFQYTVTRQEVPGLIGGRVYSYEVDVSYYRESNPGGGNYTTAIDAMETLDGLVYTALTTNWNGTVDFYTQPDDTPAVSQVEIGGKTCWRINQVYTATKAISN